MTRLRKLQGERRERGGGCLTGEKQITSDATSSCQLKSKLLCVYNQKEDDNEDNDGDDEDDDEDVGVDDVAGVLPTF